jgi:hypothetical protein
MLVPPVSRAARFGRRSAVPVFGFLLLALTGCATTISGSASPLSVDGGQSAPTPSDVEETETQEPEETTSAPAPTTSDTGLQPTTIGQLEGFVSDSGDQLMTFTVDAITVNPGCNSPYSDPPATGNFVAVAVTINILALVDGESPLFFSSAEWHIIGPDGQRDNENSTFETYLCAAENEQLPSGPLGVGTYVGIVVMDTPYVSGQVIWTPSALGGLEGWSWTY